MYYILLTHSSHSNFLNAFPVTHPPVKALSYFWSLEKLLVFYLTVSQHFQILLDSLAFFEGCFLLFSFFILRHSCRSPKEQAISGPRLRCE